MKINEELFIKLYNEGKDDLELATYFKVSERTVQRFAGHLRKANKILYRQKLAIANQQSALFLDAKKPKQLTKEDVEKLANYLGTKLVDNYTPIKLATPTAIATQGKREEISILDISDVHIGMENLVYDSESGKQIITYNYEIFLKELNKLQSSIFEIHGILSNSYKLRELVIFVMGDLLTNDRIFPEQTFELDKVANCVGKQIWLAVPTFIKFFNNLLNIYEKITIVCVVGNHGRSMPNFYEEPVENNFEYHVYKIWEKQFENNPRINVIVPPSRRYIHKIYSWRHLIEHGDSMRGSSDNYIEKQIKELTLNVGNFDVMHFGHLHKLKEREISDKVLVKQNGCWIFKESYGFKKYKTYSIPKQHFFGCNAKRPETWAYKLDLRVK